MPANPVFPIVVTFLHDLFTAAWIGGMLALALAFLPAARQVLGLGPQTQALAVAVRRRLSAVVYVSIVGLWITGLLLARRAGAGGLFGFDTPYQIALSLKHLAVLGMVLLALLRSLGGRVLAALERPRSQMGLLLLNLLLGTLVLLLSAVTAVLGGMPG